MNPSQCYCMRCNEYYVFSWQLCNAEAVKYVLKTKTSIPQKIKLAKNHQNVATISPAFQSIVVSIMPHYAVADGTDGTKEQSKTQNTGHHHDSNYHR